MPAVGADELVSIRVRCFPGRVRGRRERCGAWGFPPLCCRSFGVQLFLPVYICMGQAVRTDKRRVMRPATLHSDVGCRPPESWENGHCPVPNTGQFVSIRPACRSGSWSVSSVHDCDCPRLSGSRNLLLSCCAHSSPGTLSACDIAVRSADQIERLQFCAGNPDEETMLLSSCANTAV